MQTAKQMTGRQVYAVRQLLFAIKDGIYEIF